MYKTECRLYKFYSNNYDKICELANRIHSNVEETEYKYHIEVRGCHVEPKTTYSETMIIGAECVGCKCETECHKGEKRNDYTEKRWHT